MPVDDDAELNFSSSDAAFMTEALMEAQAAAADGDVPVGAVVVHAGEIVGRGRNRRVKNDDPLAHAEVEALKDAAARLANWRLDDATLYVTMEPCPMCAGAIVQARLGRLVYGVDDPKGGAARSMYQLLDDPRLHHRVGITRGVLGTACGAILSDFFREARAARRGRRSSTPETPVDDGRE